MLVYQRVVNCGSSPYYDIVNVSEPADLLVTVQWMVQWGSQPQNEARSDPKRNDRYPLVMSNIAIENGH